MSTFDPALLQALADRLAGLGVNGHVAIDFPEPLATLWRDLDAAGSASPTSVFTAWAGTDQARLDLANEIVKLAPGSAPPPDPWQIYTLADAYKPRAPLLYLVEGLVTVPSLNMVYGAPGVMKSLLVADLCICVASGKLWLPPQTTKAPAGRVTTQTPILWCDFDNGKRRTDERFDALGHTRNLPTCTPVNYVSMPTPWLNATETLMIEELCLRATRLGIKLLVIDNLGTITGEADENKGEMIQVMANLRYIAERADLALILLHHQRKSNGATGRPGETMRGHSSIEAALDLALLIEREEHSDTITIRSTKTRDIDVHPFGACFTYTHKPNTKELETAYFEGVEIEDQTSNKAVENAIIDSLTAKRPQTQKELTISVKQRLATVGVHRIQTTIKNLESLGTITSTPGPHYSVLYDLP